MEENKEGCEECTCGNGEACGDSQNELDLLKEELNKWKEKTLLIQADFENFKKRTIKEKEDLILNTKSKMISSILDIDSELAIAKSNIKDPGIDLIINKMSSWIKSQGLEEIQTETYDSDLHEVISSAGGNNIVAVVSKGYKAGDKVIRYPKIILGDK